METKEQFVTVNIVRGNGELTRYQVDYEEHLTVARILSKIYLGQDRTIAYRHFSCNVARCASCLVKIDGKNVHACRHVVESGADVRLEASDVGRPIRDLVTDFGASRSGARLLRTVEV